jgi:hypothetical protein
MAEVVERLGGLHVSQHSVNSQGTFSQHSVNMAEVVDHLSGLQVSQYSVSIQYTFSEHSVNMAQGGAALEGAAGQ